MSVINEIQNHDKIYLLQTDINLNNGEPIYKVGRSSQVGIRRLFSYPETYRVCLVRVCIDSKSTEKAVLNKFQSKYKKVIGKEYFSGNELEMIHDINKEIDNSYRNFRTEADFPTSITITDPEIIDFFLKNPQFTPEQYLKKCISIIESLRYMLR